VRDGFYPGYRFPIEVIRHVVWLYHRLCLSLREISDLLFHRGIVVSHETIRTWCLDFGPDFAAEVKKRRPRPGSTWHLDEVFLKIRGEQKYLWRAVDQDGVELDILVTDRRDKKAAKQFFKRLLDGLEYKPKVVVTDKLRSYGAALREILPKVKHVDNKSANLRAENSHRHVRKRERHLQKFKSAEHAESFLSCYCPIRSYFCPRRHLLPATIYREKMKAAFAVWSEISLLPFDGLAVSPPPDRCDIVERLKFQEEGRFFSRYA
jgi:putative transposase